MASILGSNNSIGATSGGSTGLTITKTYTIGYADVQPIMVGGLNDGIDEHCYVNIAINQNTPVNQNSNTSGVPSTTSNNKTTNALKYSLVNGAYYAQSKSINIVTSPSSAICLTKFIDNENNERYGYQGNYAGTYEQISYGLTIYVFCKPCYQSLQLQKRIKGSLRILVWNTQTNEYETIEALDISSGTASSSSSYIYSGYIGIILAHYYILCGILEANAHYETSSGDTSNLRWLTDEDFE